MIKFNSTKINGDLVQVTLNTVSYSELVANDLDCLLNAFNTDLDDVISECKMNFGATDLDVIDAFKGDGSVRGRKGLITSLTQTTQGANTDNHANPNLVNHDTLPNVKLDPTSGLAWAYGIVVDQVVLTENTTKTPKKETKSGIVVQIKSYLEYRYNLKSSKFRSYKIDDLNQVVVC